MLPESSRMSAVAQHRTPGTAPSGHPAFPLDSTAPHLAAPSLRQAIFRTQQWLINRQHADGYWVAELEGDTILESEFLLLLAYLGEERSPLALKVRRISAGKTNARRILDAVSRRRIGS